MADAHPEIMHYNITPHGESAVGVQTKLFRTG
jgi:hypothetical protein